MTEYESFENALITYPFCILENCKAHGEIIFDIKYLFYLFLLLFENKCNPEKYLARCRQHVPPKRRYTQCHSLYDYSFI
jgi:hypothetical protein